MAIKYDTLIDDLLPVALKAGEVIMEVYSSDDFSTTYKDDKSPLTRADTLAHEVITRGLGELTPHIPVLSEESRPIPHEERRKWPRYWLVDPLDGTKEFIKRSGEFTVNIALIEGTAPVMGVVTAPALGLVYYGIKGFGAFKTDCSGGELERISVSKGFAKVPRVVASLSHRGGMLKDFLGRLGVNDTVSMGSSLKFCLVAEGSADLYPRLSPTMEWDSAAAHAVVESAGGFVTDLNGEALVYNKEDLLNPYFLVSSITPDRWRSIIKEITREED